MKSRNKALIHAGFALLSALSIASCTKKRTAIVLWLNTDIPTSAWETVTVTATGTGSGAPVPYYQMEVYRPNAPGMPLPFPGALRLVQERGEGNVEVTVDVALRSGNGTPFQVKAKARFINDDWRQLTVFLPYQCTDEAVRRLCAERSTRENVEYTCGAAGADPCVLVTRTELQVFEPDGGTPPLPDASAPGMDATVEAGMDASVPDSMPDSAPDSLPDSMPDSMPDVVQVVGAPHPAVSAVWPRSGAVFSGGRPTLSGRLPSNCPEATAVEVVLCPTLFPTGDTCAGRMIVRDTSFAGCSGGLHTLQIPPGNALPTGGPWSWAMRLVTVTPTLLRRGPLNFRAMSFPRGTLPTQTAILDVVPDIDNDGRGDVLAGSQPLSGLAGAPMFASLIEIIPPMSRTMLHPFEPFPVMGAGALGSFGDAMLVLGDAELDGTTDVLFTDHTDSLNGSSVFRFVRGASSFAAHPTQPSFSPVVSPQPGYGTAAASGDFNRDGFEDIVLGSYTPRAPAPRVFYGSASGYSLTGAASQELVSPMPLESLGDRVAAGCDIDGDGYPDAVLTARDFIGSSRVNVFFGGPSGLGTTAALVISDTDTSALIGSGVGAAIACNGDFNGDGFADLAIGAQDDESNADGGVAVYSGGARTLGRVLFSGRGAGPRTLYGTVLEFVGSQIGTTTGSNLAIGEPFFNGDIGQVQIVGFRAGGPATQNIGLGGTTLGFFGAALRFLGPSGGASDTDGFVVGAPNAGTDLSGHIEVFRSNGTNAIPVAQFDVTPVMGAMGTRYGGNFAR